MFKKGFSLTNMLIVVFVMGFFAVSFAFLTMKYTGKIVGREENRNPSKIKQVNTAKNKTVLLKAYSDLNRATEQIKLNNGGTLTGVFSDSRQAEKEYEKYLGGLGFYQKEFKDFNPKCKNICGKIEVNNGFVFLVLSTGLKKAE